MRALLFAAAVLTLAAWANAGSARAQVSATADALFRAGREASARGDHVTACAKYRESQRLEAATGTLLNIAVCEEKLGELVDAWQHYQEVLRALADGDVRVELARGRLRAVEQRLPRIIVVLAQPAPADARVELGGVALSPASFGVPLPIDPGTHVLHIRAAGYEERSYPLELTEGEQRTLALELGAELPEPARIAAHPDSALLPLRQVEPAPAPRARDDHGVQRTLGHASLVLGGVALIASGVTFGFALERKSHVDSHCPDRMCDAFGSDAARVGDAMLLASGISLGIAALSGAAGAWLLWSLPDAERDQARGMQGGSALRGVF